MGSTCPICFDDLDSKIKASPNGCDHIFCLLCLERWSKLASFCPVDRKRYNKIINIDSEDVIQVKRRKRKRTRIVYDFTTNCDICMKDDNSDTLLLCDSCDLGFHCRCLSPPLTSIPAGLWFCPTCKTVEEKLKKRKGITKEVEADMGVINESVHKQTEEQRYPKCDNAGSSSNIQSTNVEVFSDFISVFQGINFHERLEKDNFKNNNNLSFCDNEANKIVKTFSFMSEQARSTPEFTKNFKANDHRIGEKVSDSCDSQVDKTSRTHLTDTNISNTTDSGEKSKNFKIPDEDNIEQRLLRSARNEEDKLKGLQENITSNVKSNEKNKLSRRRRKPEVYRKNYFEEADQDFQVDNIFRMHMTETNVCNTTDSGRKSKNFEIPDEDIIESQFLCSARSEEDKLKESHQEKVTANVKSNEKSKLSLRRKSEVYSKNYFEEAYQDSQVDKASRTHLIEINASNTTDSGRKCKNFEVPDEDNIEPRLLCSARNEEDELKGFHQEKITSNVKSNEKSKLSRRRRKSEVYRKIYFEEADQDFQVDNTFRMHLTETNASNHQEKITSNVKSNEKSKLSRRRRKLEVYNKNYLEDPDQDWSILCKQIEAKTDACAGALECDLQNTSLKTSDEVTKDEEKIETSEPIVEAKSSLISPEVIQPKMSKGTFSNLISDACSKNVIYGKKPKQFSKNESINQDKNVQFSVFERIEDIDSSQKRYAGINTFTCNLLGSYANIGNCSLCNDKTFATSQKFCRICKLKYSKKYAVILKCEKYVKSMNTVKNSNIPDKSDSSPAALNSSTQTLNKNFCRKLSMSALERRQYSLSRALKKIHRNKWKASESQN